MIQQDKFNPKESPRALAYVLENDTLNRRCNRCGSVVLKEPYADIASSCSSDYPYQCMNCDEDLYEIETHIGEPHSDTEFENLCCDTRDLLLLDDLL